MVETMRWVEISENDTAEENTVRGVVPGWEGMKTYYKLQCRIHGEWLDVQQVKHE